MLKQSPSRNLRTTKGFKVKHALQICLLVAICVWLLYQVKHSHYEKTKYEPSPTMLTKKTGESQMIKFGRKDLNPGIKDPELENVRKEEKEEELGEDTDESVIDGRGGGDDEIDGNDQERAEDDDSESEMEDLIDEEDREKEETILEEETDEKDNGLGQRDHTERSQATVTTFKDDDDASASNGFEVGNLRKVKEEDVNLLKNGIEENGRAAYHKTTTLNQGDGSQDSDSISNRERDSNESRLFFRDGLIDQNENGFREAEA